MRALRDLPMSGESGLRLLKCTSCGEEHLLQLPTTEGRPLQFVQRDAHEAKVRTLDSQLAILRGKLRGAIDYSTRFLAPAEAAKIRCRLAGHLHDELYAKKGAQPE